MPHLTFWNRYWRVAGDEFSIPAFCSILARIFWTSLIVVVFVITFHQMSGCGTGWIYITYLSFSLAVFMAAIACDAAVLLVSLRGSITETEQRSSLGFYLNVKLCLGCAQLLLALFGLVSLTVNSQIPCNEAFEHNAVTHAFILVVVISQLLDFSSLICCCYLFSSNKIDEDDEHQPPRDESWALNNWENRCRRFTRSVQICSCNIFGGSNITEGFDEVAKVLTDFFHHDGFLDVVPSDVVAGIVLVRIEQRTLRKKQEAIRGQGRGYGDQGRHGSQEGAFPGESDSLSGAQPQKAKSPFQVTSASNPFADGSTGSMEALESGSYEAGGSPVDLHELEAIARCSVFALAIYTHLIVIYMRPCTGVCRLCAAGMCSPASGAGMSSCCPCVPSLVQQRGSINRGGVRSSVVEGDNFCGMNRSGLSIITEHLSNTELVFVSFKNDTSHKVYAVFLDHDKEQVVIAIRGTLSLEDCITDAICEPAPLDAVGAQFGFDGKGRFAHAGMLKAALSIRAELESAETLHKIYNGMDSTLQTPLRERANCSHYKLIVTGHSLGAGAAILLSVILRPAFPSLHCFAFGTPGSLLDPRSCDEYSSFVTTTVMNNDLVCRLSFPSLCQLRNSVLDAISRARVNKMMIMHAIFKDLDSEDLMYPAGQEPDSAFKRGITVFKALMEKRLAMLQVELSLPGRIVHFKKSEKPPVCSFKKTTYSIRMAPRSDFQEILVSTTMGSNHLPDVYYHEIHKMLHEHKKSVRHV
mmetsp:Transcript_8707/g.19113  ORF Transcript_8707/g.19113 Transcript_8707/m.19113 type:complete len:753 (+) Transcript_8707:114-2372(+)|eukprot:CAMPEP_0173188408 /NCGR_PEP_ID=MMETSP1141-20130122/11239_1 /TAXON_ID=483371 /ORGANISM="non described non described, Strain CCMP2298" /LENGTH=752 /DNA_ID=CAMNT_0014112335 /DNA_START=56 /DNA_END=2314 /DNA_ORIENTATION=-